MNIRLALALIIASAGCGSIEYGSSTGSTRASSTVYGVSPAAPEDASGGISISVFYEELTPYGEWIPDPQLGQIFVPHDPEYRPYRNGHWVRNGEELVWVSYDAIGWAVCHYGQWTVLEDGRWAWIPDTEWGPAWVDWRESEQYVGWAPSMTGVVAQPQMAWVFVETTYLLVDYISSMYLSAPLMQDVYASAPPMRSAPNRRWLRRRRVPDSRGGRVAVRRGRPGRGRPARGGMRVRDPIRSASGGAVTTRGSSRSSVRSASGGSVTTRGPARSSLLARPRHVPRQTVVIGDGYARRGEIIHAPPPQRGPEPLPHFQRPAQPAPQMIAPQAPPPQVEPPQRAYAPPPTPRYAEPPPRVIAPQPPPRRVIMAPPRQQMQSPQRSYAPPPQRTYAPPPQRTYAPPPQRAYSPPPQRAQPAPRQAQPRQQPQQRTQRAQPAQRQAQPQRRTTPARAVGAGAGRRVVGGGLRR